ncbi:hypothetical protein O181_053253 [Austropuccinia psidii MF-1]|uniref:Uncharacterized protein n=1 Tax=Austropuccinia psidii MF-1 TaxID=1389203 RepID=A0A9Q3E718_9BASI|nr:hypothetical protein [Austropuccinia psidii MF-1]
MQRKILQMDGKVMSRNVQVKDHIGKNTHNSSNNFVMICTFKKPLMLTMAAKLPGPNTDVLQGFKDMPPFWPDIWLLISSATMNAAKFSEYFNVAPIFIIPK